MTAHVRRQVCALCAAAVLPLFAAGPADAAVPAPASAQPVQTQNNGDNGNNGNNNNDGNDNGNNGLWGLLGLLGLLGLAGLARRGPKPGAMAGYPAAPEQQAPPANTYPPAGPRRNPPGA
ncbi:WGxxGxxG family protein [Amycolatopsis circi]|uniref:WGxxGxxG family protein n=1 Tax=Amycolatopsis circi TaxID=871959 RepID=UPI000E26E40C|nr:WGxxGxxG family protein [Amycolatopsis circi]